MRVLVVPPGPRFSVADVHNGWVKALTQLCGEHNVRVSAFDDVMDFYDQALNALYPDRTFEDTARLANRALRADIYDWWPDLIVVVSGFFIPPSVMELIASRGHKIVYLCTESPYEEDNQLRLSDFATLTVLNDPTHLDRYERAIYLPHAYDPDIHKPGPPEPEASSDFCFVGTGYPTRIDFFEQVDWSGIDAAFGGNWQQLTDDSPLNPFLVHEKRHCTDNTDAVRLYQNTKASANIYRQEAMRPELAKGWAMGPREVELAATGCFYLTEPRPENRQVLPMIPTFVGPDDFGEQLRWWLAHDKERERVAAEARAAIADRTFTNHARVLLGLVDS